MKLRNILLAATLSLAATGAMAGTYIIPLNLSGANSSSTFGADHVAGTFTDTFTFTGATGLVDLKFSNQGYSSAALIVFDTAFLSGYTVTINTIAAPPYPGSSTGTLAPSLVPGSIVLTITGTSGGVSSYGGNINVSAVPEPETYGMLLGGLGLLGFVATRRKKS